MKHLLTTLLMLTATATTLAQGVVQYVDDEECGCELVFVDGIQTTRDGDLHGFRLADGTVIAENKYKYVDQFHGDYCKVYLDYGQCGMIDRTGREIVPCIYDDLDYPSCGRILTIKNRLCGYSNMDGEIVIPLQYPESSNFSNNLAIAAIRKDSSFVCIVIDTNGRQVSNREFDNAKPFVEGYAPVMLDGYWGMIDTTVNTVLPIVYPLLGRNQNGHFFAGTEAGLALFDYSMRPLTQFIYFMPGTMHEKRISVMRNGHYGFLDTKGNEIVPCVYDEVGLFQQGRTLVRIDTNYGIIDTMGKIILPIEYERRIPLGRRYMYYDSRALVEKDGKLGYVDLDGKLVIPFYFEQAYEFSQGLAAVRFNGRWGYIDTMGDIYMPCIFDIASPFRSGRADVIYNGNHSKVDLSGRCVKNCKGIIAWREIEELRPTTDK